MKQTDSTHNRPEGARVIDALLVVTDLNAGIQQLLTEKAWAASDRNAITIFKTDAMTVVLTVLKAGAEINENKIERLFMLQVLKGKIKIDVNTLDQAVILSEGGLFNIHEYVNHSIEALEDSALLLSTYW